MNIVTHLDPVVLEEQLLTRVDAAHPRQAPGATLVLTSTSRLAEHLQRKLADVRPAWIGLGVRDLRRIAVEIVERHRDAAVHVASDSLTEALLAAILRRLDDNRWAAFVRKRPGALGSLRETLKDLREAGITPAELNEHAGRNSRDLALAEIYAAYHRELESALDSGWTDEAGLATLATALAPSYARDLGAVFVHGAYELTGANLELIRGLDRATDVTILMPASFGKAASEFSERFATGHLLRDGATHEPAVRVTAPPANRESGQLAFAFSAPAPTEPAGPDDARPLLEALFDEESRPRPPRTPLELRHTQGPLAEVRIAAREALRAIAGGCPPHEIAIVARSLEPFAPAIEEVFDGEKLAWVTSLSQPLRREPLVRDLLLLVQVVDEDFPRRATAELAASRRLDWTGVLGPDSRAPRGDLAEPWSREAKIIGGLDEWTEDLHAWAREPRGLPGNSEEQRELARDSARRRAGDAERLGTGIRAIGAALPSKTRSWRDHAGRLRTVLETVFETAESSSAARDRLHGLLDEMERLETLVGESRAIEFGEMRRWLESAVDGSAFPFRSGDTDGVRVLDAMQLRGLTFRHVHLLGLNSGMFPRPPREDPILPDPSRRALVDLTGRPLAIKRDGVAEERLLLALVLGAARESLSVSWQRADEAGKAKTPSLALREIARLHLGRPDVESLRDRARHLPSHPQHWLESLTDTPGLLTGDEQMLLAALQGHGAEHADELRSQFPSIAPGLEMLRATQSFTRVEPGYDGRVGPAAGAASHSVSAWEQLGRCPLSFFFRHVLRVREVESEASPFEMEVRERGSRIHELLEIVYEKLRREGLFDRGDAEVLVARGLELLEQNRSMLLGPVGQRVTRRLPLLWTHDVELWLGAVREFVAGDLRRLGERGWRPLDFEEVRRQSIEIDGRPVEFSARFDRRLRGTAGDIIGDYKVSARLKNRAEETRMLKGLALQVPLYQLLGGGDSAVELLGIHPDLDESEARQSFDGFHDTDRTASFRNTLRTLVELEAGGVYPFNKDSHCSWCSYAPGCRRQHPPSIEREEQSEDASAYRLLHRKSTRKPHGE